MNTTPQNATAPRASTEAPAAAAPAFAPTQTPATPSPNPTIAVLGLGNLGRALATTYLDSGHRTTVWNRTAAKADALVERGARRAGTPAEAIAESELVIINVLDDKAALTVLTPAASALAGKTLLNLTTSTPDGTRKLAALAAEHGAQYLDGAVYAVPQTLGKPESFVLYSGSATAFEAVRPQLELLGTAEFVGTDPSLTPVHDLALLSGMYGMFAGFFQAVALAETAGIKAEDITGHLIRWLGSAAAALPGFAAEIDSGDYDATDVSNISINAVGLANILSATRARGIGTELLDPLETALRQQLEAGHGAASLSRTIESVRKAK
ncbi:NAD(P)-dependent oxidoreductase [Streptomyces sp. NPDC058657]|uniref:NAD(P)-dependent oxidoreductase n=1 Tax=unclassified Streptomyces TaxID=2593676 RepID=UPI003669F890